MAATRGAALGVFDSGLGGLTVVHALLEALPRERIVYLGDTARVPYGTRSAETVVRYARACASVLARRGVKALIVACNTVSAVALDVLRAELDLPVAGVIEPGATAAVGAAERSGAARVGVLATPGTVASGAYVRAVGALSTRLEVIQQAAPLFVPLAEEGWLDGPVPELVARRYVEPLVGAGAGVLVLGCTHYPLLKPVIRRAAAELAGRELPVVDSAEATAAHVTEWMQGGRVAESDAAPGTTPAERLELLVTDLPASFASAAERFLGYALPEAEAIDLGA
jgi:glutamate racemase